MDEDFGPPYRKSCRRINEIGHAHFLTWSCFRRQPFLKRERTCEWLADAINVASEKHDFAVWAYVFMPEHVHLLIWPRRRDYQISEILRSIKLPVTRRSKKFVTETAPEFLKRMTDTQPNGKSSIRFWQRGGGFDENVDDDRAVVEIIDYIHLNPVRRTLVEQPEDWMWSSARSFRDRSDGPVSIDFETLRTVSDPREG